MKQFLIEIRQPNSKKWVLKYLVDHHRVRAEMHYAEINTTAGAAKRLVQVQGQDRKVLARSFGY